MKSSGETTLTECGQADVGAMQTLWASMIEQAPRLNGQTAQTWTRHGGGLRLVLREALRPAFAHEWMPAALKNTIKNAGWLAHPEALERVRVHNCLTMADIASMLQLNPPHLTNLSTDDPLCVESYDVLFGRILLLSDIGVGALFEGIAPQHRPQFKEVLAYLLTADKRHTYLFPHEEHQSGYIFARFVTMDVAGADRTGWTIQSVPDRPAAILDASKSLRIVIKNITEHYAPPKS